MNRKVIFLLLDAVDIGLVERYSRNGSLPAFSRLMKPGVFARLETLEHSLAETAQVTMFTGSLPEHHGFHSPYRFDPRSYQSSMNLASAFEKKSPFFRLAENIPVLAFDLPMCPLIEGLPGTQIIGWGSHGYDIGGHSVPPGAWHELVQDIGLHPEHGIDYGLLASPASLQALFRRQLDGLDMRTRATSYLLDKYPWRLAVLSCSETHTGPHYLLEHPGNQAYYETLQGVDPVEEIYAATDRYLDSIIKHAGKDTEILVASVEGMSTNHSEVPNIAFLPEMIFRYCFTGKQAFDFDRQLPPPDENLADEVRANWVFNTARHATQPGRLLYRLRKWLPEQAATQLELMLGLDPAPFPPASRQTMNYQPAVWLEPYWPHMKAFALPTFSDGFIRLNVQGREARGIIRPQDYARECERICTALESWISDRTGSPAIDRIERVRDEAMSRPEAGPADLIVFWKDHDMGQISSESFGRIGPLPPLRAAVHNTNAFITGCGQQISARGLRSDGHIIDIAATVHDLLGIQPQDTTQGKSLLASA